MTHGMSHQKTVVQTGLWPLYRYDPRSAHGGEHPFHLDSRKPTIPFRELAQQEARFAMVARSDPKTPSGCVALRRKTSMISGTTTSRWPESNATFVATVRR